MEKSGIRLIVLCSIFSLFVNVYSAYAQSETIFRPGPGLNNGADNGSVSAGKDTLVSGSGPSVNYGFDASIAGSPVSTCNTAMARAYIQFDLSTLPADVQQVFLGVTHFPHTTYCYSNCNADFYFYPVSAAWNEMTLTYNTMPAEGAAVHGPVHISFPNDLGNKEYDITNIYRSWKNNTVPNYGLSIHSPTSGCNNASVMFSVHSSDDPVENLRPYLRVIPSPAPGLQAPENFRYTLNGNSLTINWAPVSGASGYQLALGASPGSYIAAADIGNTTQFGPLDISSVPAGTYYLAVKAYNSSQQSGYSNEIAVVITSNQSGLQAPKNLRYTRNGNNLTINWDPVAEAEGYRLGLGMTAPGSYDWVFDFGNIIEIGPIDMSGLPGTYYVGVKAYNSSAESGYSNEIAVTFGGVNIETGNATTSITTQVGAGGGVLTVNNPGDPLNGLELTVPSGSYTDARSFTISSAPVTKHNFGPDFNPITPLITVENGGGYSAEIMTIKIPVNVPAGHFAMAFIYDGSTGNLEGLPTVIQDSTSITVATRHFSSIVISSIDEQRLLNDIDTDFEPGRDDWQFPNEGSYIEPLGHCAGQSITALWYYYEKPDGNDRLYGRYDNNGNQPPTPGLWEDDSLGYRFASVIQKDLQFDGLLKKITRDYVSIDDSNTWKLFAYSMLLTHKAQLAGIYDTINGGGHAIVVYRIFKGLNSYVLYVADPNYPGDTFRQINFADGKFKPYNSGANAKAIANGKGTAFDKITYSAATSMIEWDLIGARWTQLKDGIIGNDYFPAYTIEYKDDQNQSHELNDGYSSPDKLLKIYGVSEGFITGSTIYRDGVKVEKDANGKIELKPGNNKLGIYIERLGNYVDFKYINVKYEPDSQIEDFSYTATYRMPYLDNSPLWTFNVSGTITGPKGMTVSQIPMPYPWQIIYDVKAPLLNPYDPILTPFVVEGTMQVVPDTYFVTTPIEFGGYKTYEYSNPRIHVDGKPDITSDVISYSCKSDSELFISFMYTITTSSYSIDKDGNPVLGNTWKIDYESGDIWFIFNKPPP